MNKGRRLSTGQKHATLYTRTYWRENGGFFYKETLALPAAATTKQQHLNNSSIHTTTLHPSSQFVVHTRREKEFLPPSLVDTCAHGQGLFNDDEEEDIDREQTAWARSIY